MPPADVALDPGAENGRVPGAAASTTRAAAGATVSGSSAATGATAVTGGSASADSTAGATPGGSAAASTRRRRLGALVGLRKRPLALRLATGWLVVLVLGSVLLPVLPLAEHQDATASLDAPVFARPALLSEHPLGTNRFGLDIAARVLYGARVSLLVAVSAALIGMIVGGALGVLAGERRGRLDRVLGILTNALLAVPGLVLLIAVVSVVGRSHTSRMLALGVLAIPINLRLARATTLTVAQREFVTAARALGTTRRRILARELMPAAVRPLLVNVFVLVPLLIVADASLSFLALGTPQPEPTWGNMIAEGLDGVFEDHPHIVLVPSAAMFLTVFSLDIVAERLKVRFGIEAAGR